MASRPALIPLPTSAWAPFSFVTPPQCPHPKTWGLSVLSLLWQTRNQGCGAGALFPPAWPAPTSGLSPPQPKGLASPCCLERALSGATGPWARLLLRCCPQAAPLHVSHSVSLRRCDSSCPCLFLLCSCFLAFSCPLSPPVAAPPPVPSSSPAQSAAESQRHSVLISCLVPCPCIPSTPSY